LLTSRDTVGGPVFILNLCKDNGTSIAGKERLCNFCNVPHKGLHRVHPRLIVIPEYNTWYVFQPYRETTEVPLCTDIRSDAQIYKKTYVRRSLEELREIGSAREVVHVDTALVVLLFVKIPENINLDVVKTIRFQALQYPWPLSGTEARVVDRSS